MLEVYNTITNDTIVNHMSTIIHKLFQNSNELTQGYDPS